MHKKPIMKTKNNKTLIFLVTLSSLFVVLFGCSNNSKQSQEFGEHQRNLVKVDTSVFSEMSNQPTVYYFHYTRRCFTCNAVENITKETLLEFYGDKVNFTSLNLDEEDGKAKGKELQIAGQTLLFVTKDKQINLTNEAFMHAKNNPDKLKSLIKASIDPFIK